MYLRKDKSNRLKRTYIWLKVGRVNDFLFLFNFNDGIAKD